MVNKKEMDSSLESINIILALLLIFLLLAGNFKANDGE